MREKVTFKFNGEDKNYSGLFPIEETRVACKEEVNLKGCFLSKI